MNNIKCPHCGRKFSREKRSLLANKFCQHCIEDRIRDSGGKPRQIGSKLTEVRPGYVVFA